MRRLLNISLLCLYILLSGGAPAQTASWTAYKPALFPTNSSGQINGISRTSQMKFHPTNSQKMYAVSARGGLFISLNAGTTWSVAPGCDALTNGTRFSSVCIDPTNDQILYLGGGDHNYYSNGSGVWKSTNGGSTFTQTTLTGKIVSELIMDPDNNNVIVAATNTGIYKTVNAGSTWTLKSGNIAFDDMKKKENATSRVLFASTTDAQLYRSPDFGETWTQLTSGIYIPSGYTSGGGTRIGLTPADSNYVYFYMNAKGGTLFRSADGGNTFTAVKDNLSPFLTGYTNSSSDPGQGDYNTGLGVDRTNKNIVYFVAHNVWKSTDGGATWSQLTVWYQKVHTDMHQIVVSPYNTSQLWNMNDGGIWVSTDGGNNWTQKNDGLYGYEIYHGSCSPTRRDMMSIGTQDNGELYGNSTTWYTNRGGDWQSHCVFDYRSNSSMVYYFLPDWGSVPVPRRRLVTGSEAAYGLPSAVTDISDIAFHRSNTGLAFAADTQIYRTTTLSNTTPGWASIYDAGTQVMKMHVNFGDPNRLYLITADQKFHYSTNALSASPTFSVVTLPTATSVEAHITSVKSNSNIVYITANTKVYRSSDGGQNWTNITYNLPSTNHSEIIADEYFSTNELVFVSTGGAVYYKTMNATSWTLYSSGLPSRTTIVDMSIFNDSTANTVLRTFTYGRGVWETPISNLRGLTAGFAADNTSPCPGATVTFSDLSTGSVTSRSWSFPGGNPSTSTDVNPIVVYSNPGSYAVTLTVGDGSTTSSLTRTAYINTSGRQLNITEDFQSGLFPPAGWNNVDGASDAKAWAAYGGAGGFGNSSSCMFYDNYSIDAGGIYDEFRSVNIDLGPYSTAWVKFDVAYQPYSLTAYIDSFQVLVSTNCGQSFTSVYLKYGSTLNTTGSTNTSEFVPAASQWRTDSINLNAYSGQQVILAFRNIGRYGNNLYVDNISVQGQVKPSAGPDASICAGQSVVLGGAAAAGVTYVWSPTTGLSNAAVSNPVASPSTTTTYVVTATYTSSGATGTDTVVVTVNPLPVVGIASVPPLCTGGASYTLSGTPFGGIFSGTGVSGSVFNPSVGPGSYPVSYTYTSTSGCVSTATVTVVVNALPSVSIAPAGPLCRTGSAVTLSGSPSGGTFSGTGVSGNQFNPSIGAGSYTVTYAYTDANNCSSTASTTIVVNNIGLSAAITPVSCNGGSNGSIDISPSSGSGNYSYAWSTGATTQDLTALLAGTYSVTVTDAVTGCTITGSYSVPQPAALSVTSFSPSAAAAGSTVIISGTNFTGITDLKVNNVSVGSSNYVVNSSTQITMTVTAAMTSGAITVVAGSCNTVSSSVFTKLGVNFSVRLLIQGYYAGANAMRPVLLYQGVPGATIATCDTVTVELYSTAVPPVFVDSRKVVLSQYGIATVSMPATSAGTYWLAVNHRNALQTWSATSMSFNTTSFTYNFTTAANKAYGNNMVELATNIWGFYSGDLPVKDGVVSDYDLLQLELQSGVNFTGYNAFDLNGDGILEAADYSLLENNYSSGVQVIRP